MGRKRYGPFYNRNRRKSGKMAVLILLFWAISGYIMLSFILGGPIGVTAEKKDVGKMYIGNIFPTVSRSSDFESREALGTSVKTAGDDSSTILDNEKSKSLLVGMMDSMFPAVGALDDLAEEDPGIVFDSESIEQAQSDNQEQPAAETPENGSDGSEAAVIDGTKPVVIIYHTHATESYQPVTEGNFHSLKEYGTVREVGDVLTEQLRKQGIQVIHDKTLHDTPSYNESYSRSLETIKTLMASYDSPKIVIDLHRDAAAYLGNVAKTVSVNKENIASYSLVIGNGNPNVEALKNFANKINQTAEKMYPGFGGKIIEKQYKFNQYVADNYILLEIGNNENTIEQSKGTAKYIADVLAEVIKDMN